MFQEITDFPYWKSGNVIYHEILSCLLSHISIYIYTPWSIPSNYYNQYDFHIIHIQPHTWSFKMDVPLDCTLDWLRQMKSRIFLQKRRNIPEEIDQKCYPPMNCVMKLGPQLAFISLTGDKSLWWQQINKVCNDLWPLLLSVTFIIWCSRHRGYYSC